MHSVRLALSQVKFLSGCGTGSGIPSISTAYAQARGRCAQVIHMFVHRQQGSGPLPRWQAAAARRAGACVPGQSAGCEDLARAWMRSPTCRGRRSPPNCLSRRPPSRPTCATCTPSSAHIAEPKRLSPPAPWACSRPPHTSADSPAFLRLGPSAFWQIIRIVRWPLSPTASRLVLTASGLATCAGRSGRSFRYEARD
jgi:hypothetical protein